MRTLEIRGDSGKLTLFALKNHGHTYYIFYNLLPVIPKNK